MKILALFFSLSWLLAGCGEYEAGHPHGLKGNGATENGDEYERGPNRGRMLRSGDFAVEVTIFEEGPDPEFFVYPYWRNKQLDPKDVKLSMSLKRLGGRVDQFEFAPQKNHLKGNGVVKEPHSFDVAVNSEYRDERYSWSYASYEGRTTIDAEAAQAAGVKTEAVGAGEIAETIDLPGRVVLQPQARADIRAWYPGRIIELTKGIGEPVKQGELLARVESSESLRTYAITSPITGIVTERSANVGDVPSQAIYVVSDPTRLQAAFFAFPRDAERLRPGQPIEIRGPGKQRAQATTQIVLPSADPLTQTVAVYAELGNPSGVWRPGMVVEGIVTVDSKKVPLAVRTRALQRFRDFTVVYAKVDDTYEVRMLKLGRKTSEWTEVLSGIEPGEVYVTDNAFLIRADVEKSGAAHDH